MRRYLARSGTRNLLVFCERRVNLYAAAYIIRTMEKFSSILIRGSTRLAGYLLRRVSQNKGKGGPHNARK